MLSSQGSAMLAWNFRTFNLSHRLTLLQSETFDFGMNCHKACIVGLIPKPRGSSVVPDSSDQMQNKRTGERRIRGESARRKGLPMAPSSTSPSGSV